MGKFAVGLFVGRFQPFHKGHMHALRWAAGRCDRLIIGIGSSQEKGTERNPIEAGRRIRIIRAALRGSGIRARRLRFLEIPDLNDDGKWFGYIMGRCGADVVFSRSRLVGRIFRGHGIPVLKPPWHRRNALSATRIRRMIRRGGGWESHVPERAVAMIRKNSGSIKNSAGAT